LRAVPVTPLVFGRRCTKEREEAIVSWTGHGTVCTANKHLFEDHLGSLSSFDAGGGCLSDQGTLVGSFCW
jgi:hypothetical protein